MITNHLNRRRFLKTMGLGSLSISLYGLDCSPKSNHPNIVFIMADDLGYGDVSCLNPDCKIPTPNIDSLAAKGIRFTDAHSGSAVCTPTRYGVLTGRYSWRTRLQNGVLWGYSNPLIDKNRTTVASFLKKHGYSTACVGKWHLGWNWALKDGIKPTEKYAVKHEEVDFSRPISHGPKDLGFDYSFCIPASLDMVPYVYVENDHVLEAPTATTEGAKGYEFYRKGPIAPGLKLEQVLPTFTRKAVDFIQEQADSPNKKPFFLYFPLSAPHTPILPTKEFQGKSGLGPYGDFVVQCDWTVGQVVKVLKQNGMFENTLFIFTSDNGCSPMANFNHLESLGHDPSYIFRGHKADIFEGGHRIPFIVSWPEKVKAGNECSDPICLTDLLATTAELVEEKLPENAGEDSVSFLPDLLGTTEKPVREAVVHHSINGSFSIRQGKWKLELCPGSGGWSEPVPAKAMALGLPLVQLYDLTRDIEEQKNLQAKYPEVVHRLINLLEDYVKKGRSTPGAPQKNDVEVNIWKSVKLRDGKSELSKIEHLAVNKTVTVLNQAVIKYSENGTNALTDGIRATSSYNDGFWAGVEGDDVELTVDLGEKKAINKVGAGFLEDQESWIFFPPVVVFSLSNDGKIFGPEKEIQIGQPKANAMKRIKNVVQKFDNEPARYVKVVIKNLKTCPQWHAGAGGKSWIFCDEIWVE